MSSSQRSFFWLSVSKGSLSLYLFISASTLFFWTHTTICSNLIYLALSAAAAYNLPVVALAHLLNRVWLCDPMDYSMPGFPVLLLSYFPEFIASSATSFSFCLQSFPASGSFPMSPLFPSGGLSIGASATASVLPMNIQGWFPLGLAGLISLLSKGLSRVFSSTTIWKHQFFSIPLSLWNDGLCLKY